MFSVSTPFCENKSTDLKVKTVSVMECLFRESITFGEAKSTDMRAMGSWTVGRTDNLKKNQNPFQERNPSKKG